MAKTFVENSRIPDFRKRTYVMGILNCTPDSFYTNSRKTTSGAALEAATDMIEAGVDIVDVGGESSRPGAEPVSAEEERSRVVPVIEAIRHRSNVLISVDTTKVAVARPALEVGADIVNDISGLKADPEMASLISDSECPVIIMHMRGSPQTMQKDPYYENTIEEIVEELKDSIRRAVAAGISENKIIIDPGIGFGKRLIDNLRVLKNLDDFRQLGMPILIGLSRKSFLGTILENVTEDRLVGTITANSVAVCHGANILRVHDFKEGVQMAKIIDAIRCAE